MTEEVAVHRRRGFPGASVTTWGKEAIMKTTSARPDFLCIGMQRAGTRWLYDQLNAAEGVWMPPIKEINYFSGKCFKPGNMKALEKAFKRKFWFNKKYLKDREFLKRFERGASPGNCTDDYPGVRAGTRGMRRNEGVLTG